MGQRGGPIQIEKRRDARFQKPFQSLACECNSGLEIDLVLQVLVKENDEKLETGMFSKMHPYRR